ncbi:MAG TPA: YdeI/OmpD-associated family protein [Edaphocola sp.]|nr:YdeI/OmpD-associated family protein [Edaphocola sp.]
MNTLSPSILHQIPEDIKATLSKDIALVEIWNKLTPIQRNEWICWVSLVVLEKTREEHLERMVADLYDGKKKPCCWPGCPHRNPKNAKWFKNLDQCQVP